MHGSNVTLGEIKAVVIQCALILDLYYVHMHAQVLGFIDPVTLYNNM